MNNKKCPYCGFINFVTAEACRKCETMLTGDQAEQSAYDHAATYRGGVSSYTQPYKTSSGITAGKVIVAIVGSVFGLIVAGAVMGLIRSNSRVKWVEYHPEGQEITVMMPDEPTREEPTNTPLPMGSVSLHTFTSVVEGQGVAAFAYADYFGVEFEDTSKALDEGLNGLLQKSKSTLVSKNPIYYQGMPGLEFELTPPESAGIKNARGYGKLLLSGNRLHILFITATENTDLIAGKDRFLNPQIAARPQLPVFKVSPLPPIKPMPVYQPN